MVASHRYRTTLTRALWVLAATALVLACSDGSTSGPSSPFGGGANLPTGGGSPELPAGGGQPTAEGPAPTGGTKPETPPPGDQGGGSADNSPTTSTGPQGKDLFFLLDKSEPLVVYVGEEKTLPVKVIDYAIGGPAAGATVKWTITDAQGEAAPGDAALSTQFTVTDDQGVATVKFQANSAAPVTYRVEASTEGAEPDSIQVAVLPEPSGDLRVVMTYDGPVPIHNVTLRVVKGPWPCTKFNPVHTPPNVVAEKTVLGPDSKPKFTGLKVNQPFTVVATALGPSNTLVAAGCRDGVLVQPDVENQVTLDLYILVLNPAGKYDMDNVFDLTGAIPGQLGEVLDTLVTVFYDPGKFLVAKIKDLVKQYLPSFITDFLFSLFEDQLANLITDWLLNDAPGWVQDFFTIGQDILQVVARLELTGILTISKLQNDYYVEGNIAFTGIVFTWKLNCDKNAPDYDQCGKYPFDLQDINDPEFPLDLLEGSWKGTIAGFDKLTIEKYSLALNYGKLIYYMFTHVILKELTGKTSLKDAMADIIGCDSIADALDGLGLFSYDQIYSACSSAVGLLVLPVESYLLNLETDSLFSLQGTATLVDEDSDLIVDRIVDGKWTGQILVGGAGGNPFTGEWSAVRIQPNNP